MSQHLTKDELLLLEEYIMVNDLLKEEGQLFWSRFNILLAVEVFLFSACSFFIKELGILTSGGSTPYVEPWIFIIIIGLCILLGIGTTFIWFSVTEKGTGMILFFTAKLLDLEKKLPVIKKQADMYDIFYRRRDKAVSAFAKKFHPRLRKTQRLSITGNIRFLVMAAFIFWGAMLPLLMHIAFSSWLVTGLVAIIPGVLIILYLVIIIMNAIKTRRRKKGKY